MAWLCSSALILDYIHMGLFSFPQGLCCSDFSLLVFGLSQLGSSPLALDFLQMGSLFPLRSYMHLDSTPLLYGCSLLVARLWGHPMGIQWGIQWGIKWYHVYT